MRIARYKQELTVAVYHVFSRVVDRLFRFDDETKESFRDLLWRVAGFSGVEIITYAVMSNHFHILVRVQPKWTVVEEKEVLRRVGGLYGNAKEAWLRKKLVHLREAGELESVESLLDSYRARMNDISEFMKTLKLRMTIEFNRDHDRVGTLWEGRFGSVLLEDTPNAEILRLVAAYIDLNPVRAKIVKNPAQYPWCGYGEASSSSGHGKKACEGLAGLYRDKSGEPLEGYRELLQARAGRKGLAVRSGPADRLSPRDAVTDRGKGIEDNPVSLPLDVLHVKNGVFTRGRAIGRRDFMMSVAGPRPVGGITPCHGGRDGDFLVSGCLARRKGRA